MKRAKPTRTHTAAATGSAIARGVADDCPHGPGRPRCPHAKRAILDAALVLLRDDGFWEMSIEAIAERAGVSKATVYRWWPNKASLVVDAFFAAISPRIPFPDTGSAREDFAAQMERVAKEMRGPTGAMLAQLVTATQCDPSMRAAFRERWLRPRRAEGTDAVRRGIARGELPEDLDIEFLFDALYGPLYLRLLFEHQPISTAFVRDLVTTVFGGLTQRSPRASRGKRSA